MLVTVGALAARILSNPAANMLQKKLSETNSAILINLYSYLFLSLFCIYPALNNNWYYGSDYWCYAALAGILCTLGSVCLIKALQCGEMSLLGPINSYKAIIGLIFGMIILHEFPNIFGLIGIALIIFGSYFILETPRAFLKKDIQYRIYALIFSAIEAVFIKKVIILSSITTSFITSSFLGALFSFIIMSIFSDKNLKIPSKKHSIIYILTAMCFGLMTFTTAYVFRYMNVGYALSLFQLSIIINVILGYKLFNEKNLLKKLIGSLIILIGSATIMIYGH